MLPPLRTWTRAQVYSNSLPFTSMSEYWVSKKRYFCKYCEIYIADDAPSRQQHENGLRHKGNVERFIRGIYKSGEKQKKDLEEEKREMARVERAANAAFAQDVGAGIAKPTSAAPSTSKAPSKPLPKPSNPFANYSTAESLGYTDPDADRIAAELKQRQSQGVAGEWEIVTPPTQTSTSSTPGVLTDVGVKRAADAALPDEEDSRSFKLRKKTLTGFGEIYDPGLIPIKLKKKEEESCTTPPTSTPQISASPAAHPTQFPKWKTLQLKGTAVGEQQNKEADVETPDVKPDVAVEHVPLSSTSAPTHRASKWVKSQWSSASEPTKMEDTSPPFLGVDEAKSEDVAPSYAKIEETLPDLSSSNLDVSSSAGSLFRKRKAPAGAGRGRRQI